MPTPSFLAEINFLDLFLRDNLLSPEEVDRLTAVERANLRHELVHRYVKSKIITVERAKSLSKDEFSRLTNYGMIDVFTQNIIPIEELLTLSTRRAIVLSSPNVRTMRSRCLLTTKEALELDSTFDFLDEDEHLCEDVMYYDLSPHFALEVHQFYISLSTLSMLTVFCNDFNERNAELYNIQLFLDPRTATQCCAFVCMIDEIMEEIRDERRRMLDDASEEIQHYVASKDPFMLDYFPASLRLDTRKIVGQSNGYRDYCSKLIQDSFHFLRSTNSNDTPVRSTESEQNRDRRLKTIGLHLNSMWQRATPDHPILIIEAPAAVATPQ